MKQFVLPNTVLLFMHMLNHSIHMVVKADLLTQHLLGLMSLKNVPYVKGRYRLRETLTPAGQKEQN